MYQEAMRKRTGHETAENIPGFFLLLYFYENLSSIKFSTELS